LTHAEKEAKTACGGEEPLRASFIHGRHPNKEKTVDRNLVTVSKFLAKHLRHAPDALGLTLQPGGWVAVDDLLAASERAGFTITYDELLECVETNDKQRFSFDDTGDLIRANQGHSVEVDLHLEEHQPPDVLYHGTVERFLASILTDGLQKGKRHHVHLSKDTETARKVGARRGRPVILQVDAGKMHRQGFKFFLSANSVWLTDSVPAAFLARM
jgi:putative RNA 2'-phosphotransferase